LAPLLGGNLETSFTTCRGPIAFGVLRICGHGNPQENDEPNDPQYPGKKVGLMKCLTAQKMVLRKQGKISIFYLRSGYMYRS
jgi:hypothetical protein